MAKKITTTNGSISEIETISTSNPTTESTPAETVVEEVIVESKPINTINSNKATVLYDKDGNPVFLQPNTQTNSQSQIKKAKQSKKIGPFIASIITLVLGLVFTGLAVFFFFDFINSADSSAGGALLFFVYLLTGIGIATLLPGLGLSIASLVCSIISCKSSNKGIKIVSGFVIAFSIIALVVSIAIPFFLPLLIQ